MPNAQEGPEGPNAQDQSVFNLASVWPQIGFSLASIWLGRTAREDGE